MFNDFYNKKLVPFISEVQTACRAGAIPLTFDNSLSYYEQIAAFSAKLNEVIAAVNNQNIFICDFMTQLQEAFAALSGDFAEKWTAIQEEFTVINGKINGVKEDINDLDERVTALEEQPPGGGVGETVAPGTFYRIGGTESPTPPEYGDYTAGTNCEIFNGYSGGAENGAAGDYSKAEGYFTKAMCDYSHAEGYKTIAAGTGGTAAHAEGSETIATGAAAHAEGSNNRAYGDSSHAEGAGNRATGYGSHCGGLGSTASGAGSFAHGIVCESSGNESIALGAGTIAQGDYQLVIGCNNVAKDTNTRFIIGKGFDSENRANALEIDRVGNIYCNGSTKSINEELADVITEVTTARGTYPTLDDRLDDMSGGGGGNVTNYISSDYTPTFDINVDTTSFNAVGMSSGKQHQTIIKIGCRIYQTITDYNSFHVCDIVLPVTPDGFATGQVMASKFIPLYPTNTGQTTAANYMILAVWTGTAAAIYIKSNGFSMGSSQWDFNDQLVIDFIQA